MIKFGTAMLDNNRILIRYGSPKALTTALLHCENKLTGLVILFIRDL